VEGHHCECPDIKQTRATSQGVALFALQKLLVSVKQKVICMPAQFAASRQRAMAMRKLRAKGTIFLYPKIAQ